MNSPKSYIFFIAKTPNLTNFYHKTLASFIKIPYFCIRII